MTTLKSDHCIPPQIPKSLEMMFGYHRSNYCEIEIANVLAMRVEGEVEKMGEKNLRMHAGL